MSDSRAWRRSESVGVAAAADFVGQTLAVTAEQLCRQYGPAVCRFAAMAARTPSEADDIAQDALLRAVRGLSTFDAGRGSIEAWLWRIVANAAHDSAERVLGLPIRIGRIARARPHRQLEAPGGGQGDATSRPHAPGAAIW